MTEGLICARCGAANCSEVRDSRAQQGGWRRRRVCSCGHRFTTMEVAIADEPVTLKRVVTQGGAAIRVVAPPDEALRAKIQAVLDDPAL